MPSGHSDEREVSQQREVVHLLREVLGSDLLGVYLYGSAVLGGLRPHSDVDVFAVSRRTLRPSERRRLMGGVMEFSGRRAARGPARPVELTIVTQADVRPWRYPPLREFQYGEWLRDEYQQGMVSSPMEDPDLASLITQVLQRGLALDGPPPDELLDPVPNEDLRRAIVAGVPDLLDELESDTRNVLLTLARIWMTLKTGEITSKDAAAQWAIARLPEGDRPILDRARAIYLGEGDEHWTDLRPRVRPVADRLVGEIKQLAG